MSKPTKTLLGVSLAAFAVGCTGFFWGIGTPVGAICFGLFLVSRMLEKETALFDEEQQHRLSVAKTEAAHSQNTPARMTGKPVLHPSAS